MSVVWMGKLRHESKVMEEERTQVLCAVPGSACTHFCPVRKWI